MLLLSSKSLPAFLTRKVRLLFVFAAIVVPACLSFGALTARAQQVPGREIAFPTPIQWNGQRTVTTYRLQIAADEMFQNVFFDGLVTGERYQGCGLPPGYYYWKVAAADFHLGDFSKPVRFFVSGGVVTTVRSPPRAAGARSLPVMPSQKAR